jgi:chemotaxis protein methyltransferase CheR
LAEGGLADLHGLKARGCEAAAGEAASFHYPFTPDDFGRIRALIYRVAGIALAPGKKDMVYSRLARRLRARELESFADYLELLDQGDEAELEAFINALTTNMTSFFREPHHFRIMAERLAQLPAERQVSIWTCAASTGEEPYSIAMTALDARKGSHHAPRVLATDIDTNVLETARKGVYPVDQQGKVHPDLLRRYFLQGSGKNAGFFRVRDEVKQLVSFRRLNLLDGNWPMRGRFDFLFCRNVMIYFDKQTQHRILERLAGYLEPGGLLFVGHSESFHGASDLFKVSGNTVYTLR